MSYHMQRLIVLAFLVLTQCLQAAEPSSFATVMFPVPEGWTRFQSTRPKTVGLMLHGGKTEDEADGMIQLDIGRPAFKTAREFADSIAGKDGTVDPNPLKLGGVEALRVTTPSTDFARPKVAIIAFREEQVFFLAAAAKPGFDVEPALNSIIESWHWLDADSKRLSGDWNIERVEVEGKAVNVPGLPTEFSIHEGRFTLAKDGQPVATMKEMLVAVDLEKKPAHLSLIRGQNEELPCLYEVENDRLMIAMPLIPKDKKKEDPLPRPAGFDTSKEPIMLFVAKKKAPPMPAEPATQPEPKQQ